MTSHAATTSDTASTVTLRTMHSNAFAHQAIEALDYGASVVVTEMVRHGCMCGTESAVSAFRDSGRTFVFEAGRAAVWSAPVGSEAEFEMLAQAHRRAAIVERRTGS